MELDFLGPAIPAIIVIVVILALEEWVFFKASSKLQRAVITGVTVFVIVFIVNLLAKPSF